MSNEYIAALFEFFERQKEIDYEIEKYVADNLSKYYDEDIFKAEVYDE